MRREREREREKETERERERERDLTVANVLIGMRRAPCSRSLTIKF
jgi:hypothetical protein